MLNQLHNEKLNAWYLTHIHDGVNFFLYTSKPHQDGRFDGMRIRSVPIYDGFFRHLGADPVRMAPPEVGTALERGAVDGYGWPLWGVVDFGWHKFTKYRHGPGFFSANINVLVNLDRWNGLGDSQRACLNRMTDWLDTEWPKWREAEGENQAKMLADAGVEYVDLGAAWAAKAESLYWEALEEASPEFIGKIRPLLE
jgi:TRAP-type C4-dicarboxylate transport system substrate-binding protein